METVPPPVDEMPIPEEPPAPAEVPEPEPPPQQPVCECPVLPPAPPPPPEPARPAAPKTQLVVLGEVEQVQIDPPGIRYRARLDTGRALSYLHALEVHEFERDGKAWVRFQLAERKQDATVEVSRPVVRTVGSRSGKRYVVNLKATVAGIEQFTDFILTDRSQAAFPVLIGRDFLRDQAVVDVGRRYTLPESKP